MIGQSLFSWRWMPGAATRSAIVFALAWGSGAGAQQGPGAQPATNESLPNLSEPPSQVLTGRPDSRASEGSDLLGTRFVSQPAGISFRAPLNCRAVQKSVSDEIVSFYNEQRKWVLKVSTVTLPKPVSLANYNEVDALAKRPVERPGLLKQLADRMTTDAPDAKIFRQEIVNVASFDAGILVARFALGKETNLTQQALVQSRARVNQKEARSPGTVPSNRYILFNLTTGIPRDAEIEQNADVKQAVETFNAVLDSIEMLDTTVLREDQNERLMRTRSLFVNLTEAKIKSVLVPEQWLRLMRDGKDIGYSYVVEEVGKDLPRPGGIRQGQGSQGGKDGVLIGVRSRSVPEAGVQVDAESWSYAAFDRRSELWSNVALTQDAKGKRTFNESGTSLRRDKAIKDKDVEGIPLPDGRKENPGVRLVEETIVEVADPDAQGEPVRLSVSPWYITQAISHLIPRLVADSPGKTFLFALYNSETKSVWHRYVDVQPMSQVTFMGKTFNAVQVRDRLGIEGSVTIHYVTPKGQYLGSYNAESKVSVVPTDAATLEKLWKDLNLRRPGEVAPPVITLPKPANPANPTAPMGPMGPAVP